MLKGLSYRNAKRQAGKYFIYWGSLIGAVALIYGFNALIFSTVMQELSSILSYGGSNELGYMIIIFSVIITFILGWFVSYMMNFMLRKRSREISTYMILGIDKKQIIKMLFSENLFIGGSALIVGWLLGIFVSEVLESIVIHMFRGQYSLSPGFSLRAAGMTFLYFCLIYLVAQFRSKRKLDQMKLINLLHYDQHNEVTRIQNTRTGIIFFCISIFSGSGGIYLFSMPNGGLTDVVFGFLLIVICLTLLFIGLGAMVQKVFEKSKYWKYKKTNLFLYRLLSSKINGISIALGIVATLFTISISCIGMANAFYSVMNKAIDLQAFDITILHREGSYDFSNYAKYLLETTDMTGDHKYNLYTEQKTSFMAIRNNILSKYLKETGKDLEPEDITFLENQYDTFMRYSDYNRLREIVGLSSIEMGEEQFIVHCMPYLATAYINFTSGNYKLEISNQDLTIGGIYTESFSQYNGYVNGQEYLIIIPDYLVDTMDIVYSLYVATTKEPLHNAYFDDFQKHFDTLKNLDTGVVVSDDQGFASKLRYENMDYISGKYALQTNSQIIIILPLFYLALILCISGTVILAVQLLSESDVIVKHYRMLRTLGMAEDALMKILRKHVFIYFLFPLVPAVIFGGILVFVFARTMLILSFDTPIFLPIQTPIIQAVAITITIFMAIYWIYVFIAYTALKKEVVGIGYTK